MRSVLGLVSEDECRELELNARLVSEKKKAERLVPLLQHQAGVDHHRVEQFFGLQLAHPSEGLFKSEASKQADALEERLHAEARELETADQRANLRDALDLAIIAETRTRDGLEDASEKLDIERAVLDEIDAKARGEQQSELLSSLPPGRQYCNMPMKVAIERGCPCAQSRPLSFGSRLFERQSADELLEQRSKVDALASTVEERRSALARDEVATSDARKRYLQASTAHEAKLADLSGARAALDQVRRRIDEAEIAWKSAADNAALIERLEKSIAESREKQAELRELGRELMGRFSATFNRVVKALLGDEVQGKAGASGRSLMVTVERGGERDSAALSTLKLLGFDLAAMTFSVEGHGHFPRFLIHDGPREADMASDVYERLFLYVKRLEETFRTEPSFQYIVTTTTPPPEEVQGDPWVRLVLGGAKAEERLFRMDL